MQAVVQAKCINTLKRYNLWRFGVGKVSLGIVRVADGGRAAVLRIRGMMSRQVEHLARLVDDLMDVWRITGGKVELRMRPTDLNAVLARAAEVVRPPIDPRGHHLTVSQTGRPVWVSADLTRLTQVVGNLLTNSAEYSDEGCRIDLVLEEVGDRAVVRVRDTGAGIPPDMLPRIFDLFRASWSCTAARSRRRAAASAGGAGSRSACPGPPARGITRRRPPPSRRRGRGRSSSWTTAATPATPWRASWG